MICGLLNLCLIPLIWLIGPCRSNSVWVSDLFGLLLLAFLGSLVLGPSLGIAALVKIARNKPELKGRIAATIGFIPVLAAAIFFSALAVDIARSDTFLTFKLTCSVPKKEYVVGDTIEVTFEILRGEPHQIRLYEDRPKSLRLLVRAVIGDDPDMNDNDFWGPRRFGENGDKIEIIDVGPGKPFSMTVTGQIVENEQNDGIVFDFGAFGRFEKDNVGEFSIGGYWMGIRPAFIDPLEDYTNKAYIEVKRRQAGSGQDTSS